MAARAFFNIENAVEDYLRVGSDEAEGCAAYIDGEDLDVNLPEGKRALKGVVSGLKKIAAGIERDAGLRKRV